MSNSARDVQYTTILVRLLHTELKVYVKFCLECSPYSHLSTTTTYRTKGRLQWMNPVWLSQMY